MPIKPEDIKKVVLNEDDFGHELRVGDILATAATHTGKQWIAHIEHGGSYVDYVTRKPRQFDYRARIIKMEKGDTPELCKTVAMAVECKNVNPEFPLIVCGRPREDREAFHALYDRANGSTSTKRFGGRESFYKPAEFVGKSLLRITQREVKRGGKPEVEFAKTPDSDVYDRWAQALASCHELGEIAWVQNEKMGISSFIVPLVVVPNKSLWISQFSKDGSINTDPTQVERCEYFVEHKLAATIPIAITHIHFVTCKGFKQLLEDFLTDKNLVWNEIFNPLAVPFPY